MLFETELFFFFTLKIGLGNAGHCRNSQRPDYIVILHEYFPNAVSENLFSENCEVPLVEMAGEITQSPLSGGHDIGFVDSYHARDWIIRDIEYLG